MDLAETRPRTVLALGAIGGVLLGGLVAAITPTAMIYAPDPPWRVALPGQIRETAWIPTASAPEDPAPRFADAYGYVNAGWSFPPALRVEWRQEQYEPYPVPAYEPLPGYVPLADSEPGLPSAAAPEVERTAREAAETAAVASTRAAEPAPPAEPAPSEDELIPIEIEG